MIVQNVIKLKMCVIKWISAMTAFNFSLIFVKDIKAIFVFAIIGHRGPNPKSCGIKFNEDWEFYTFRSSGLPDLLQTDRQD